MRARMLVLAAVFVSVASAAAHAQTVFYLDSNGNTSGTGVVSGGTYSWANTGAFWRNGTSSGALTTWSNAASTYSNDVVPVLGGTAGTITLDGLSPIINGIRFTTGGYVINTGSGAGTIDIGGYSFSASFSPTANRSLTVNASIGGDNGLTKLESATGTSPSYYSELVLGGANTYSGDTTVRGGGSLSIPTTHSETRPTYSCREP